jgi:site-specific DNA-methyltransferase (adenine-specific)
MRSFLGDNDMMAYLAMMAVRMLELHRVLRPTGSLYLHCDPTASHYLKLLLDAVFGADRFQAEIIWRRTSPREAQRRWPRLHDVILQFVKDTNCTVFHPPRAAIDADWLKREYRHEDEKGRYVLSDLTGEGRRNGPSGSVWRGIDPGSIGAGRHWRTTPDQLDQWDADDRIYWPVRGQYPKLKKYLEESSGTSIGDLWMDVPVLGRSAAERLGYPTQKPLALLERIIAASSNEGDVILDPFCGCGTAVHAAQKLGRQWIGIDVTHLAISLIEKRMQAAFPNAAFTVEGTPKDLASAEDLARRDKYQFQWWAVSMVDAMPFGGKKKGADGGIDGIIYFKPDGRRTEKALVSVKGGDNVGVQMIRDLHSAMEREKAPAGIFLTKTLPTSVMEREAAAVGRFAAEATGKTYPRLQIITLAELFQGKRPDLPYVDPTAGLRRAAREDSGRQAQLL